MIVTETPTWTCPFGCIGRLEAATVAERYDHAIDFHLAELKHASAQTLNEIVTPKR